MYPNVQQCEYLGIRPDQVQSAVDFCIDHKAEIEDQIRGNQRPYGWASQAHLAQT
jgi:hypothetical protein